MELVKEYLQRPKEDLDPVLFSAGYSRIVQRTRQPLGFSPKDVDVLLMAPPGTFKNILFYRGNYYVAHPESEYPHVGLKMNGQIAVPVCLARPQIHLEGQVTLEHIWEQIGSRFSCDSLSDFQTQIQEKAGLDRVRISVQ